MKTYKQFHEEREQLDEAVVNAIKFFVDFHRKNKNKPLDRNLWTVSRIVNMNYKKLEDELHRQVLRGMIPKEFAYRSDVVKQLKSRSF